MKNRSPALALTFATALLMTAPAGAADDWSFIAGKYAKDRDDCQAVKTGAPFSKDLMGNISHQVLTKEGVTDPRGLHLKFRSSTKTGDGWTVKADCESVEGVESCDATARTDPDGSVTIVAEDMYMGPVKLVPCK